jgi:hypothetical protein
MIFSIALHQINALIIMKKALFLFLFVSSFQVVAEDIPKFCLGNYTGEVDGFDFVHHDKTLHASSQLIKLVLLEDKVIYTSGKLELVGEYKFIAQSDNKYLITAEMTNDVSINFVMKFVYDKKTKELKVDGSKGTPDFLLEKA